MMTRMIAIVLLKQTQTNNHNILLNLFASNSYGFTSIVVSSIVNLLDNAFIPIKDHSFLLCISFNPVAKFQA